MRYVVIDTKTTGLSPKKGDRIVEIAAIAIEDGRIQHNQVFHRFIDPQRDIPPEVVCIHGIDAQKLADEGAQPFLEIGREFYEFVQDATLVFHNAPFDLGFIKNELAGASLPGIDDFPVIDSLLIARQMFPEQRNNPDALCDRFSIDRSHSSTHGALLYATLKAQVFLAMSDDPASEDGSSVLRMQNMSDLIRDVYRNLEPSHKKPMNRPLPTGIAVLDEKHGSIQIGDLVLIAGQPGSKKIAVASDIIDHLVSSHFQSCSVLIFSLRHSAMQWTENTLSSAAKVDIHSMASSHIHTEQWRAFAAASERLSESDIHVCDTTPVSITEVCNACRHFRNENDGDLFILIDDMQRINVAEGEASDNLDFGTISYRLKNLTTELNASIILLTELPRSLEQQNNREPDLSDLQRFGSIDKDADIVLFIHRDKVEISLEKTIESI